VCLGVPGLVARWISKDPLLALAEIDFGGIRKRCHMACVLEAQVGDYVLVHAGIAQQAARQTLDDLSSSFRPTNSRPSPS
jgi:hydrogenase expression/formation protein HypC